MRFYWLTVGALAVWRITHLVQAEDGPGEVLVRLRRRLGACFWGRLMDCFYCLSVWVALPFAASLGESWSERALLWPALSGAAILLERATSPAGAANYWEDKEEPDVLLRTGESAAGGGQPGGRRDGDAA
jgi:hypothetical protein